MTFFEILRSLLFSKNKNNEEINNESLAQFTPFMVNRWLSFYDNSKTIFVNETLNRFTSLFEDRAEMYKLYNNLIPQFKFKKINYIKKNKEKKEEDNNIAVIAKNNMLSIREVQSYIDLANNKIKCCISSDSIKCQ
jgi:hypothetical protein